MQRTTYFELQSNRAPIILCYSWLVICRPLDPVLCIHIQLSDWLFFSATFDLIFQIGSSNTHTRSFRVISINQQQYIYFVATRSHTISDGLLSYTPGWHEVVKKYKSSSNLKTINNVCCYSGRCTVSLTIHIFYGRRLHFSSFTPF